MIGLCLFLFIILSVFDLYLSELYYQIHIYDCYDLLHACMLSHSSHIWLFVNLWTVAFQAPLSMGYFRHEYWSGLPCPPPWDLSHPGIKSVSPVAPGLHQNLKFLFCRRQRQENKICHRQRKLHAKDTSDKGLLFKYKKNSEDWTVRK